MSTILLTWNPDKWPWDSFADDVERSRTTRVPMNWTVSTRGIVRGDRAFLLRQGRDRGIVASAEIRSAPYQAQHWDGSGRTAEYVDVELDVILDVDERLPVEILEEPVRSVHWAPRQSGTKVPAMAEDELDDIWQSHLAQISRAKAPEAGQ